MTAARGGTLRRMIRLTPEEQQALVAALYVVKDNWWLTEIEERVLERLELGIGEDEDEREDAEHDAATGEQREEPLFGLRELATVEGGVDGSLAA
jgi:hypothetical protein